jgi:hypothetical protein
VPELDVAKVEVHVADAFVPVNVQVVNVPVTPDSVSETVPVGVVGVGDESATITVHVVPAPATIVEGLQASDVEVGCRTGAMNGFHDIPLSCDVVVLVSLFSTPFE